MENFELKIDYSPCINRINGRFVRGHVPFNKGIPMSEWMDGRKIKRIVGYLKIGRIKGNATMAGSNRIQVVGIRDGKIIPFESATAAEKILRSKGIRISKRNITACVRGKRKRAGGFLWFKADDVNKYKDLLTPLVYSK